MMLRYRQQLRLRLLLHRLLQMMLRYHQLLLRLLKMHCRHDDCDDDDRYDRGSDGGFYVRMLTAYQTLLMS
jgi:hypothetical protein